MKISEMNYTYIPYMIKFNNIKVIGNTVKLNGSNKTNEISTSIQVIKDSET
jgi:hypothetical protein